MISDLTGLTDSKTTEAVEAIIEKEMAVYSAPLTTEYWASKVWCDTENDMQMSAVRLLLNPIVLWKIKLL